MKTPAFLIASAFLLNGSIAIAQQQYDSLGMPTPAPNQKASPNAVAPNAPAAAEKGSANVSQGAAPSETTGSGSGTANSGGGTLNTGTSTPTDNGATPSGLTPE
jgi:hypothetical protein